MIVLKDHKGAEERVQNLHRGEPIGEQRRKNMRQDLEDALTTLKPPGIKPIEKVELSKKWGPLVPEEYRNEFCKAAEEEDLEVVRLAKKKKRAEKSTGKSSRHQFPKTYKLQ